MHRKDKRRNFEKEDNKRKRKQTTRAWKTVQLSCPSKGGREKGKCKRRESHGEERGKGRRGDSERHVLGEMEEKKDAGVRPRRLRGRRMVRDLDACMLFSKQAIVRNTPTNIGPISSHAEKCQVAEPEIGKETRKVKKHWRNARICVCERERVSEAKEIPWTEWPIASRKSREMSEARGEKHREKGEGERRREEQGRHQDQAARGHKSHDFKSEIKAKKANIIDLSSLQAPCGKKRSKQAPARQLTQSPHTPFGSLTSLVHCKALCGCIFRGQVYHWRC